MDRLTSMAVFVKVADLGSFTAAAAAFDLSGPMVGKHIRGLEDRLGVRLVNRTTRRQSLTDFGRAYYDRCRAVLAEVEAADALAADELCEPRGRLRVAMPALYGRHCVAPILTALAERHPALEFDLSLADTLADLAEGTHDLAIRTGALRDASGLVTRRLARQRMIVCAAPDHVARHGAPATLADLPAHRAILYRRGARPAPWLFARDNAPPVEIEMTGRLRLDDLAAIADAAAAGLGLAWLPGWLVRDRLAAGTLVRLLPDAGEYPYDVHALWPRQPRMALRLRIAIDALAAGLPPLTD